MDRRYVMAAVAAAMGVGTAVWVVASQASASPFALFVAAIAPPTAIALGMWGRIGGRFPGRALVGGASIGPLVAVASHAAVAAFAYAFFLGFADGGRALLDSLRIDPRIADVLSSPWVILALVEFAVVAPLTEETGKALGAGLFRPRTREEALMAGVAAGAGFAAVENVLYAGLAAAFGGPWPAVVVVRAAGAAVHPLATGLVVLGRWDRVHGGGDPALVRGFFSGVGVHALWNGALVALAVAATVATRGAGSTLAATAQLAFDATLGALALAALWSVLAHVIGSDRRTASVPVRRVAGWILLSAALVVPVAVVVIAFPSFAG